MLVKCLICGKEENVRPARSKTYKTCSKECLGMFLKAKANLTCSFCGNEFHQKNSRIKRSKNQFCSRVCLATWKSKNQFGINNPNFRNKQYDSDGKRIVHLPHIGRVKEHVAVVYEILKINKHPDGYVIHHRDCNPLNNNPENLVLLTESDHRWIHKQYGNATLYAYQLKKISFDELVSWSNDQDRSKRILNLNILQQAGVFKSGELLEKPEVVNQQPSTENDIKVSVKVQRLESEESTNKLSTSARQCLHDWNNYGHCRICGLSIVSAYGKH